MRKVINPFLNKDFSDAFVKADLQTRIDGMRDIKDPKEKKPIEHKQEAKKAS